jgi:hypothetical protein
MKLEMPSCFNVSPKNGYCLPGSSRMLVLAFETTQSMAGKSTCAGTSEMSDETWRDLHEAADMLGATLARGAARRRVAGLASPTDQSS